MNIAGSGITPFEAQVLTTFVPKTTLALRWAEMESGLWVATDRGVSADTYDTVFDLYGKESVINQFVDEIEANRVAGSGTPNVVYFYNLNSGEKVFGADVDITQTVDTYADAIRCTITGVGQRTQGSWKGFGVQVKARSLSPSFTGSATLPTLKPEIGYDGDASYTIRKTDSYDGTFSYIDRRADVGTFTGKFVLSVSDMANIRRYIAAQRSSSISLTSLSGVSYPFGRRSGSYPYTVKIIKWRDLGQVDSAGKRWGIEITFAEVP